MAPVTDLVVKLSVPHDMVYLLLKLVLLLSVATTSVET
jgi:hypothetical protein